MSSQQNNQDNGLAMGLAVIVTGLIILGAVILALAAFAALICTVLCLCAWDRPITLFGQTLTTEEARRFVRNGLIGACLTFCFMLFVNVLFGVTFGPDYIFYVLIAGYVLGAFLPEWYIADQEKASAEAALLLPPSLPSQPSPSAAPSLPPAPFRFASWDDEEELR